jgi:hypothetical protein
MSMPGVKVTTDTCVVNSEDGSSFILYTKTRENEKMLKLQIQLFADDQTTEEMYLEQINELKTKMENEMISKEDYKKLQAQHKKLMDDYVNRRPVPQVQVKPIRKTKEVASELAKIKNGDITNREYVQKTLEYRNAHIHEFGTDPFTDFSQKGPGTATDDTNEVATTLQTLLDENQSPVDFRIKLNSILEDDQQLMAKMRKRA